MVPVLDKTQAQLVHRRDAVLSSVGFADEHAFWAFIAEHTPSAEEWEAKVELEEIAFLLGEGG